MGIKIIDFGLPQKYDEVRPLLKVLTGGDLSDSHFRGTGSGEVHRLTRETVGEQKATWFENDTFSILSGQMNKQR